MTSLLGFHGELTLTRNHHTVIVRGRGQSLEVEVPGLLWAFREFRALKRLIPKQVQYTLGRLAQRGEVNVTVRTRRRRWITFASQHSRWMLRKLGFPPVRVHLRG